VSRKRSRGAGVLRIYEPRSRLEAQRSPITKVARRGSSCRAFAGSSRNRSHPIHRRVDVEY
jgi:hypothetical protein